MADDSSSFTSESDEFSHSAADSSSDSESGLSNDDRGDLGARPYMFEPERESDSDSSGSDLDEERELRLGNSNWCTCGECQAMPTARESVCCREIDTVMHMTDTYVLDLDCITKHPGFQSVCLDRWVLDTAYMQYRQQYGGQQQQGGGENRKYRHTAYRQLARWCWGYLGHKVRVLLPSCAVCCIRETFPSGDGQYQGFNEVFDN